MQPITVAGHRNGPIRVLEVIGNANVGGMERYIANFLAQLPADEFRVTCICPYESPFTTSLRQLGVEEVYVTPIEDDPAWRSIQLTAEVARIHQIDVLHAHMPKAHVLAGIAGSLIHKPVVATVHGMNVTSHELGITRAVNSYLITNCQEAYTQALAMGVASDRVTLVRNGIDTAVFTPDNGNTFRKAIDVSKETPLVGFVGRLEHEKGPDLFLRAAHYIHQHRPDVHFVIVGDGEMRKELKELCAYLQLDQQVHFEGWWTTTSDIYPSLDILAHTSRSDGTSLVLLEAMSCACPVVALAVGGVREIVESNGTGMIVGAGDWEGVGVHILRLLEQPERLRRMGAAARTRVEQRFNLKTHTQCIAEILRHVGHQGVNGQRFINNNVLSSEVEDRALFDSSTGKAI